MVNINEEITYNKQSDFVDYLFALGKYGNKFESTDFNPIVCYQGDCFSMIKGKNVPNTNEEVCKAIKNKLNSETLLIQLAKIDFDYGVFEVEDNIEKEAADIVKAFEDYCRMYQVYGFIVNHFDENDVLEGQEVKFAKHSHIVYVTEPGNKLFSDYLLEVLY